MEPAGRELRTGMHGDLRCAMSSAEHGIGMYVDGCATTKHLHLWTRERVPLAALLC